MSITPKELKNKEFNRETFEDQLPKSGRIYDESLNVANEAHLLGAPYRISTKHTDWEATSGDTTIGFDTDKLWGHAVSLASNGTAQPAIFASRFEQDYFFDLTQFKHGYVEFYIKTPDKDAVPAEMFIGLVTDADDTSLGVYALPFALPSDISNDSWERITLSLDEFETGSVFGSPDFDLTNIEGVMIGTQTPAEYTIVISGLSVYADGTKPTTVTTGDEVIAGRSTDPTDLPDPVEIGRQVAQALSQEGEILSYLSRYISGEDSGRDVMKVQNQNDYEYISTNTTTTVKSGAGHLKAITVGTKGASSNTMTVYDNTAGSGDIIAVIDTTGGSAEQTFHFDCEFTNGLTIVTATGTAAKATIIYS